MDIRPSSMTEMLMKLEDSGLIARRQDEQDQRVMRNYLTVTGRREAEQLIAVNDEFADSLFNTLSEEEKEQMLTIIERLCLHLGNSDNNDRSDSTGKVNL